MELPKDTTSSVTPDVKPDASDASGSVAKRGPSMAQWSPYKQDSKRMKIEDTKKIMSYIFFDFETVGLIGNSDNLPSYVDLPFQHPYQFQDRLKSLLDLTQIKDYSRITEMSFVCIPRDSFVRGVISMRRKLELGNTGSIMEHIACNVHTRQLNPELSEAEWQEYETKRMGNPSLVHSKDNLRDKNTFRKEWPEVVKFLDSCPKPACLVAHNGLKFDYRVLFGELSRTGFLGPDAEKLTIPSDVLMVDSLLAFREIEDAYRDKLKKVVEGIDWTTVGKSSPVQREKTFTSLQKEVMVKPSSSGETTPVKNPDTASESVISSSVHEVHPMNHFKKTDWSTAQLRRIDKMYFRKKTSGEWEFRVPPRSPDTSNKLGDMYRKIIRGNFNAHFAQDDSEALMQICMAFGNDFVSYCDQKASESPY